MGLPKDILGQNQHIAGQGGSFGVKHTEGSLALLAQKMASVKRCGAQAVVTSRPGGALQLVDGVRRHGLRVQVMHISRLFAEKIPLRGCENGSRNQ